MIRQKESGDLCCITCGEVWDGFGAYIGALWELGSKRPRYHPVTRWYLNNWKNNRFIKPYVKS